MPRADAASSANGLSQTTARPSSSAWSLSGVCVSAGVEIATASAPAARNSSSEPKVATPGCSCATSARRSAEVVTTPRNSHSGAAPSSGAWKYRPPKP